MSSFNNKAQELIAFGHYAAERHWCPANGGNFSARLDDTQVLISASGAEKGHLTPEDILTVDMAGKPINSHRKPSDETLLHTALYSLDKNIQSVLHVHTVANTVLSLSIKEPYLRLTGYEMLKPISGIHTHEAVIELPIFDNTQDMHELAQEIKKSWDDLQHSFAFLVRGHGCYCWGSSIKEAKQHLEAYEFLFACELERVKIKS